MPLSKVSYFFFWDPNLTISKCKEWHSFCSSEVEHFLRMQKIPSSIFLVDSGHRMVAVKKGLIHRQVKKLVRSTSWTLLHIKWTSLSTETFLHRTLSRRSHLQRDGLSSKAKVKRCKYSETLATRTTTDPSKTKSNVARTSRDVKYVVIWHRKSHCHSRDSRLRRKNLERERLRP